LLRGTRQRSGFALARAAEELGGRLSAYSRPSAESVAIEVPAAEVEPAIRLAAETLLAPRLAESDLSKEKTLLIGSLATAHDQPNTLFEDELYRTLFTSHRLSRLASLTSEQVRAVTIADVRAFQRSRLDAARLALIVVGRAAPERVRALASELFGAIPAALPPPRPFAVASIHPPPRLSAELERRVRKRTTQPTIALALPTEGVPDSDAPAFAMVQHVLTGFDERLYTEIREKRGYAYWIRADGLELPSAGAFAISTGAKEKYFGEIERILRSELARIANEPVSAEEMRRALRYLETEEARRDETNTGRIGVIANALVDGAPLRTYEERVARLTAVEPGQIQALARRLFAGRHMAVIKLY
ncbi:MAG TPA: pitrilysin family protein, partial [Thermoanaerobaculia bacterium]